jgi:hypothetical protein
MKLVGKLLFVASALGIVLTLGMNAGEKQVVVNANPFKTNHQQYERVHKPTLVVNKENNNSVELKKATNQ